MTIDTTTTTPRPYEKYPYGENGVPPYGVPKPYGYWPPFWPWYYHPYGGKGQYEIEYGSGDHETYGQLYGEQPYGQPPYGKPYPPYK